MTLEAEYKQAAAAWAKRAVAHGDEIERLRHALVRVRELAEDAVGGSAAYAEDRLMQVRKLVDVVLKD